MKKLWFFDLDGTLADTDRDIREAWPIWEPLLPM